VINCLPWVPVHHQVMRRFPKVDGLPLVQFQGVCPEFMMRGIFADTECLHLLFLDRRVLDFNVI